MHYAGVTDCRLRGETVAVSWTEILRKRFRPTPSITPAPSVERRSPTNQLSRLRQFSRRSKTSFSVSALHRFWRRCPMKLVSKGELEIYMSTTGNGADESMMIMRDDPTFINWMVPASRGSGWIHLIYKHFHATKKHFLVNKNYILLFGASWVQLNKKETRFKGWLHVNVKSPIELSDSRLDR